MQPILIIVLAAALGVPLGLGLRRNLATLSYRKAAEVDLPVPGPRWWVVWASLLVFGSLAAAAVVSHDPRTYLPLLPLAVVGPWLAAVDFDVLRIPNRALLPAGAAALLATVGISVAVRDWRALIVPMTTAAVTGSIFVFVHFATKGGIGFGDVKLAAVTVLATASLGATAAWLGLLAGSAIAIGWARAARRISPIAYGPWLLCGSWLAAVADTLAR